jgi:hypothetical protein
MSLFKLPENFKPASLISSIDPVYINQYPAKFESVRKEEVKRLNALGARITDYLALIQSGNIQLSDFEALLLAIELLKTEDTKEDRNEV